MISSLPMTEYRNTESATTRKRIPTMGGPRKTIKNRTGGDYLPNGDPSLEPQNYESMQDQIENENQDRTMKIDALLNKMANVKVDDAGSGLANYDSTIRPLQKTSMFTKEQSADRPAKLTESFTARGGGDLPIAPLDNPYVTKFPSGESSGGYSVGKLLHSANDSGKVFSNYRDTYEPMTGMKESLQQQREPYVPYYAKYSNTTNGVNGGDKIMEKINYITHLLEEQQMEKTNHIAEEFILYSMLGVFVIYIVDSFHKMGKYSR